MKAILDLPRLGEFRRACTLVAVGNSAAEILKAERANAGRVFRMMGRRPGGAPS